MINDNLDVKGLVEVPNLTLVEENALSVGLNYLHALNSESVHRYGSGSTAYLGSLLRQLVDVTQLNPSPSTNQAPYDRVVSLGACWALAVVHGCSVSEVFPGLDLVGLLAKLAELDCG